MNIIKKFFFTIFLNINNIGLNIKNKDTINNNINIKNKNRNEKIIKILKKQFIQIINFTLIMIIFTKSIFKENEKIKSDIDILNEKIDNSFNNIMNINKKIEPEIEILNKRLDNYCHFIKNLDKQILSFNDEDTKNLNSFTDRLRRLEIRDEIKETMKKEVKIFNRKTEKIEGLIASLFSFMDFVNGQVQKSLQEVEYIKKELREKYYSKEKK